MSTASLPQGEQLYATLLLNDSYLPGALVLAHSLRDAGTKKKLAILVTLDSVSADAVTQLKALYDYVLPVPRIRNGQPSNLHLMNRPDLHSAFTKINLWKQTQFSKIVYIDADVVAYRAPDELFELPHAFSAAPDIGWPDLVNTGVMVLTPNAGDYYAMLAMAERGISFDGADQGLINMHFKHSINRLSFTYNVTPSAHYQYIPAYRHFQSSISMVHFIGANKPWFSGRNTSHGNAPYDEMVGRWWAVYDRHYRAQESTSRSDSGQSSRQHPSHSTVSNITIVVTDSATNIPPGAGELKSTSQKSIQQPADHHGPAHVEETMGSSPAYDQNQPPSVAMSSWDAQWHPPPPGSKPEAIDFPSTHYEMSRDTTPFVPPVRYPSPPKNMWYELPKEPPSPSAKKPRQIFPWEAHQPTPSRSFTTPAVYEPVEAPPAEVSGEEDQYHPSSAGAPDARSERTATTLSTSGLTNTNDPVSEAAGGILASSDPWGSYARVNAWDDVPEIGRYVEGLQRHRGAKSQKGGTGASIMSPKALGDGLQMPKAFKVTDFPTEVERPSLPVTPAPIRRPSFWGDDNDHLDSAEESHTLPLAEGVPPQSEWVCVHGRRWGPADCPCDLADVGIPQKDPAAQLQMLAKQQSEALLRKLSGDDGIPGRRPSHEIPSRSLPFGSEPLQSPTYVAQSAPASVLSPQPIQGRAPTAGIVDDLTSRDDSSPENTTKGESPATSVEGSKELATS